MLHHPINPTIAIPTTPRHLAFITEAFPFPLCEVASKALMILTLNFIKALHTLRERERESLVHFLP